MSDGCAIRPTVSDGCGSHPTAGFLSDSSPVAVRQVRPTVHPPCPTANHTVRRLRFPSDSRVSVRQQKSIDYPSDSKSYCQTVSGSVRQCQTAGAPVRHCQTGRVVGFLHVFYMQKTNIFSLFFVCFGCAFSKETCVFSLFLVCFGCIFEQTTCIVYGVFWVFF